VTLSLRSRTGRLAAVGLALVWLYPLAWTLVNAVRSSADVYRAAWDVPWPPAFGNLSEAWARGDLGVALYNSMVVTALTVVVVLAVSITAAYALTWLRPSFRTALFLLVLAPLIVPTEVVIVPLFAMFRALGLIDSLPGLALANAAWNVSFATVLLAAYFRTVPGEIGDAAKVDGAGRLDILVKMVVPIARPAVVTVGALVAVLTWNDFAGAVVLLQDPQTFTVQLALTRFSTFYATDHGLTFAGMAITFVPPLLLFLLLSRSFMRGVAGAAAKG
jgi:raffinose/stachyose/melibiose transport system permease protein